MRRALEWPTQGRPENEQDPAGRRPPAASATRVVVQIVGQSTILRILPMISMVSGGGSGIRTHDTVARIHAFQACAFSHSAIPPRRSQHGGRPALGQVRRQYRCGDRERKRIGAGRSGAAPQGSAPPPAALAPQGLLASGATGGSRTARPLGPGRHVTVAALQSLCIVALRPRRADGEPAATRSTFGTPCWLSFVSWRVRSC